MRDKADIVWLTNEYELGDFGMGGMHLRRGGYVTPSKGSPKDAQGRPLQEDVWKYLFTSDVDVTGKPVPAEAGVRMDQRSEAKPKKK